jgi:hypothetical protein
MSLLLPDTCRARYQLLEKLGQAVVDHDWTEKQAREPSYDLSGMFQLYQGAGVLNIPNALVRGIYSALDRPGIQLPQDASGRVWAHAVVLDKDEVAQIGPDKLTERGKRFRYRIGGLLSHEMAPAESRIARVWVLLIHSPELQQVRRSYGLSSLPGAGGFYCLVAIRRRGVLNYTSVNRLSLHTGRPITELPAAIGKGS